MTLQLTSEQIWKAIEKEVFAVLGVVTVKCEARTVGIVYVVKNRRLYIASGEDAWKVKHISQNPHVSLTIPIHKRILFMPWIKIPSATITFSGTAQILDPQETPPEILHALFRGMESDRDLMEGSCLIEVTPEKDFLTYGIGTSLMQMRDPDKARGRAPTAVSDNTPKQPA